MKSNQMKYITSLSNQEIKNVVKLHSSKGRKQFNKFIVEGTRSIETISEKLKLDHIYILEQNLEKIKNNYSENLVTIVSENVMKKISAQTTPSGILAVFFIPEKPSENLLTPGLVLAQVSDPGNMGTLIRTAAACNIKSVVIIEGTDPWSPKSIQATAGTIAFLNIFQWTWKELIKFKKNLKLFVLVPKDGKSISEINRSEALLIVGSEAHGIPNQWLEDCDNLISLPMPGKIESLNASAAGSIALYLTFCLK